MTGDKPGWYWLITWRYLGPVLGLLLFIAGLYDIGDKGLGYSKWIREKVETCNAFIFQFLLYQLVLHGFQNDMKFAAAPRK